MSAAPSNGKAAMSANVLLLRKLALVFALTFVGSAVDAWQGWESSSLPLSKSVVVGVIVGAIVAGLRALIALSPVNVVPSDAQHTVGRRKPAQP